MAEWSVSNAFTHEKLFYKETQQAGVLGIRFLAKMEQTPEKAEQSSGKQKKKEQEKKEASFSTCLQSHDLISPDSLMGPDTLSAS